MILYEQADQSPVGQSPEAQYKWKNFLNQAKHWIGVLPPFMSLTVLVSHPAATAPFPKYVTVGLLWIATSTLLQNFNGLFGHEVQSMESQATTSQHYPYPRIEPLAITIVPK